MVNLFNKIKIFFCNFIWILSTIPETLFFFLTINKAFKIQSKKLFEIIDNNKETVYGKKFKFQKIHSYQEFKKQIPIHEYEDFSPFIKQIQNGKKNILTREDVIILEPTSGSSGKEKYIPYTKMLKKEFQKAISPWLFDIYFHHLSLLFSQSYWSISPQNKIKSAKKSQKLVGFQHDSEYLGKLSRLLMKQIMAIPSSFQQTKNMFLSNKNIGLISIWSPTFLNSIFAFDFKFTKNLHNIKFISAWGDSTSFNFRHFISDYFPQATFQPKGLISTESFCSFPLIKLKNKSILAYQSHFFEFLDSSGETYLFNEVNVGKTYTLIITTSGGLYRYNTHDVVKIIGFYKNVPLIRFIGRDNQTSDFFGEKLNETFVQSACWKVFKKLNIHPDFFILIFHKDHYRLLIDAKNSPLKMIQNLLEKEFENNFHYKHCLFLKQLKPLDCFMIKNGIKKYIDFYQRKGIKLGDIKPKILDPFFVQE